MIDRFSTVWLVHRRAIIVAGAMLCGLLALLFATGLVIRFSGRAATKRDAQPTTTRAAQLPVSSGPTSTGGASDVAFWNALPSIEPAVSKQYPALPATTRSDPASYAAAFVRELFTRDYATSSRAQLLAWAQYENAPMRTSNYPSSDWTKVLVDSLTDITWDGATDTPVPATGVWLALANERASTAVSNVAAQVDPQWETRVSQGFQPNDPLMTVWDVTAHVTQTGASGRRAYDISIAVQLGTSPRGLYGVAATNNYVIAGAS